MHAVRGFEGIVLRISSTTLPPLAVMTVGILITGWLSRFEPEGLDLSPEVLSVRSALAPRSSVALRSPRGSPARTSLDSFVPRAMPSRAGDEVPRMVGGLPRPENDGVRSARLQLQVVGSDGAALVRARVELRPQGRASSRILVGRTDESGRSVLEHVPPGVRFDLEVSQFLVKQRYPHSLVFSPEEVGDIRFVLLPDVTLTGTVTDEAGAPVACRVSFFPADRYGHSYLTGAGDALAYAFSDHGGRFKMRRLYAGLWWVRLDAETEHMGTQRRRESSPAALAHAISIPHGVGDWDVDVPARAGLWISGHVVDSSGNPVVGLVDAESLDSPGTWSFRSSAEEGFELGPLAPGTVELTVTSGSLSGSGRARAGDEDVRLVLELGGL